MPSGEILTVGTEILLGEIADTNARELARALRALGIDVYRTGTVGDNEARIAQAVREALERADLVIVTGGLGPTVDDVTREGVAAALGVGLEFRSELWAQVQERFRRYGVEPTDNNRRQALVPLGALALENPVGTAPAFLVGTARGAVVVLPGVPREMSYMMEHAVVPYLRRRFDLTDVIKVRVLHTAGLGESQVDDRLSDLEALANPTVGLAAHPGRVDVRITVKSGDMCEAAVMLGEIETEVRRRLGRWIYGADEDRLADVALAVVAARGWRLVAVEAGLGGALVGELARGGGAFLRGEVLGHPPEAEAFATTVAASCRVQGAEVGLGALVRPLADRQELLIVVVHPGGERRLTRYHAGPPEHAPRRAANLALDLLRAL